MSDAAALPESIEDLLEGLSMLPDWDERYRALIDLGRSEAGLPTDLQVEANKVQGCVSQVWVVAGPEEGDATRLRFRGDSDSFIVKGLIALLLRLYSGRTAEAILATDSKAVFARAGLDRHLSPLRSNGLASIDTFIRRFAAATLAGGDPAAGDA